MKTIGHPVEQYYSDNITACLKSSDEKLFVWNEIKSIIPDCNHLYSLLAVKISSNDYVIWIRDESLKNINWTNNEVNKAIYLREKILNINLEKLSKLKVINSVLQVEKDMLVSKNSDLTNFAYTASHDLKEPLRIISGYNNILLKKYSDKFDSDGLDFLKYTIDGANRMNILIDTLLKYANLDLNKIKFKNTDINNVLNNVLKSLEVRIQEKNAIIEKEVFPDIIAHQESLELLFQNLISNSLKYCKNEIPEIKISLFENESEYIFSVKDNGIGISPEYHEVIFKMFKRLHGISEYQGTGIGLSTVKKIVEHHNGRVWVESKENEGSVFNFSISKFLKE